MDIDWLREHCLSLAHTTEQIQWEDNLLFKVGGKMYAIVSLEPGDHWISFKCAHEQFAELVERPGVIPAPYLARAHWVALETENALPRAELKEWLRQAHALIFAKLPKKTQLELNQRKVNEKRARAPKLARRA